jgi:cell division control protein 6
MTIDYFEDLLKKPSIFKNESALGINFIPDHLPHREKELSLLSQLFLILITNPNSISRKVLITGKTGIGKTVTVKLFCEMLRKAANNRNLNIECMHINCRKEKTSYKALIKIVRSLNSRFPKRGYSPQDLLEVAVDLLNKYDMHLLVILDELSYLISNSEDLIYSLTRVNDDTINCKSRISIVGIVRDISCLSNLDISTLSTLQKNIINFKDYDKEEIFDIIKYRIELSLINDVITDDLIKMIANSVYKNGDIRYGLNLIWKSAKLAENKGLRIISAECIRLANKDQVLFSTQDILKYMSVQKLIFLLSIVKSLSKQATASVSLNDCFEYYNMFCENLKLSPRSCSQLWNYLQDFKKDNVVVISIQSESIRGRKSMIQIPEISLAKLEELIKGILKTKGLLI